MPSGSSLGRMTTRDEIDAVVVRLTNILATAVQSHMQMITLMLSAVIIYPCHQFFRAFSFRHVGPLRR